MVSYTAVNPFPGLVHTARHTMEAGYTQSRYSNHSEEGEDDVKSSCPLCPGLHTCYNGYDNELPIRKDELIYKHIPSSDCRLQLAYMKVESLVIAGQLYCGESVPGPCTHRPSHHGSWLYSKLLF